MDIICFCHLRWNFVYQRPQHLMSRFAQQGKVVIVEEPVLDSEKTYLERVTISGKLEILIPHIIPGDTKQQNVATQCQLLKEWFNASAISNYVAWYYTPMAIPLGECLPGPEVVVYDCMDELSAFRNAPETLKENEKVLMQKADLVFTGGYSLYEAKKDLHGDVHAFPSSIDKDHFATARKNIQNPADQASIPHPVIGFFGVIDERMDIELLKTLAEKKPGWHFVLVGPVVKIDPATLPVADNIHYIGARSYEDLPKYLSGWDVALIPFALNESTRFISPTKTPEYLAGGVPVVSSPLRDVINPYGNNGLVQIAATADEFVNSIEQCMKLKNDPEWIRRVDDFLADISWDVTWIQMTTLIQQKLISKTTGNITKKRSEYV